MKFIALLLSLVLLVSECRSDVVEAMQSVCLLPSGTGFAYKEDEENIYILTDAHVIEPREDDQQEFDCFFFRNGRVSNLKTAHVSWVSYKNEIDILAIKPIYDLAELYVKKKDFEANEQPTIIPLANKDDKITHGQQMLSIGCPHCIRPSMFHGSIHLISYRGFFFQPDTKPGRSGSPIFDIKGERVIGMIRLTTPFGGFAQNVQEIHRQIDKKSHR